MFHDTHPCLYRRIPGTRVDDFLLFASVIIKQNVGPLPPPPFGWEESPLQLVLSTAVANLLLCVVVCGDFLISFMLHIHKVFRDYIRIVLLFFSSSLIKASEGRAPRRPKNKTYCV